MARARGWAARRALLAALPSLLALAACAAPSGGAETAAPPQPSPTAAPARAATPTRPLLRPGDAPLTTSTADTVLAVYGGEDALGAALRRGYDIQVAAGGAVWVSVAAPDPGLARFDGQRWERRAVGIDTEADSPRVALAAARGEGSLLAAVGCTAARIEADGATWRTLGACGAVSGDALDIAEGPGGSLWIAAAYGLYRVAGSPALHGGATAVPDLLPHAAATSPDGTLWVARSPLDRSGPGVVSVGVDGAVRDHTAALPIRDPLAVAVSAPPGGQDASIWVGGTGGAARLDGGTWARFTEADGLPGPVVRQLAAAPDGAVWAVVQLAEDAESGTALARFDGRRWRAHDSGTAHVYALAFAGDTLWLATEAGVVHLAPALP